MIMILTDRSAGTLAENATVEGRFPVCVNAEDNGDDEDDDESTDGNHFENFFVFGLKQ